MSPIKLPVSIQEKVAGFPEYRMGAHKIAVRLKDGRVVEDVIVAWSEEIVSVGGRPEVSFATDDVVDAEDRS